MSTDQVEDTTDEIVKDEDVQQALATFTVDQLYANVDVQAEIEQKLPSCRPAARGSGRGGDQAARHQRG